jgi:hypothetical protein
MQSDMWAWLFSRVPADCHNQLMLVTRAGTEIAVQNLLRIEPDFIAIKGRLSGSQDAGRVFFIPFANIDYFGIQRDVREEDFNTMFGLGSLTVSGQAAAPAAPAAAPPPAPIVEAPGTPSVAQKTPLPLKSEVLERFRSRIAGTPGSNNGTAHRPPNG